RSPISNKEKKKILKKVAKKPAFEQPQHEEQQQQQQEQQSPEQPLPADVPMEELDGWNSKIQQAVDDVLAKEMDIYAKQQELARRIDVPTSGVEVTTATIQKLRSVAAD